MARVLFSDCYSWDDESLHIRWVSGSFFFVVSCLSTYLSLRRYYFFFLSFFVAGGRAPSPVFKVTRSRRITFYVPNSTELFLRRRQNMSWYKNWMEVICLCCTWTKPPRSPHDPWRNHLSISWSKLGNHVEDCGSRR